MAEPLDIPTLDTTVLKALDLIERGVPPFPKLPFSRPLVVGSGNALETGRIIFRDVPATFASESKYQSALDVYTPDGAVLISASGGKHSTEIAKTLVSRGVRTLLFTHTLAPPAAAALPPEDVTVFPKNAEPYTYNTSTYFGLVASHEHPDISKVRTVVAEALAALPEKLGSYRAYTLVLPSAYSLAVPMLRTKFSELFGGQVAARVFAEEDLKHAKTTIYAEDELYIVFDGADTQILYAESDRVHLPLGEGYLAALAVTYATIGRIQADKPPYFQNNIERYMEQASKVFNQNLNPIVD